jgi:phage shock protein E
MSNRARLWLCAALLLALLGCGRAGAGDAAAAPIGADELERRIRDGSAPLILDVRTLQEYTAGHIPGAVLIPHDELAGRLAELEIEPGDEIVVHCQTGRRTALAEQTLAEAGYTAVRPLDGDMQGWKQGGHPVENGPPR